MIAFVPLFFFGSLYAQISLGDDASGAGLYLVTFFGGFAAGSQWGGRILDSRGARAAVVPGLVVAAVGFALWANSLDHLDLGDQWIYIVIAGIGVGLVLGPANTDAINRAPRTSYGEATGITQTVRNFGSSLGLAVLGTVLILQNKSNIESSLGALGVPKERADAIADSVSQGAGGPPGAVERGGARVQEIAGAIQHDFASSTQVVFYAMAGVLAVAFVVAWIGMPHGKSEAVPEADEPATPARGLDDGAAARPFRFRLLPSGRSPCFDKLFGTPVHCPGCRRRSAARSSPTRSSSGLCEEILGGVYAPGEKLPTQRALAADLGVNMASIREAVKRLEQLRLVEVRHGDAMRVRDWRADGGLDVIAHLLFRAGGLDRDTLASVLEARRLMLAEAAGLAAGRRSDEQAARLAELAERIATADTRGGGAGDRLGADGGAGRGLRQPRAAPDHELDPRALPRPRGRLPGRRRRPRAAGAALPRGRGCGRGGRRRAGRSDGRRADRPPGAGAAGAVRRCHGRRGEPMTALRRADPARGVDLRLRLRHRRRARAAAARRSRETDAVAAFDRMLARAPRLNRVGLRALLHAAELAPRARRPARACGALSVEQRAELLGARRALRARLSCASCSKLIKGVACLTYYGDDDRHAQARLRRRRGRRRARGAARARSCGRERATHHRHRLHATAAACSAPREERVEQGALGHAASASCARTCA